MTRAEVNGGLLAEKGKKMIH